MVPCFPQLLLGGFPNSPSSIVPPLRIAKIGEQLGLEAKGLGFQSHTSCRWFFIELVCETLQIGAERFKNSSVIRISSLALKSMLFNAFANLSFLKTHCVLVVWLNPGPGEGLWQAFLTMEGEGGNTKQCLISSIRAYFDTVLQLKTVLKRRNVDTLNVWCLIFRLMLKIIV